MIASDKPHLCWYYPVLHVTGHKMAYINYLDLKLSLFKYLMIGTPFKIIKSVHELR